MINNDTLSLEKGKDRWNDKESINDRVNSELKHHFHLIRFGPVTEPFLS
jgi:hypothetical protein